MKNIGAIQLYSPDSAQAAWPKLERILKKAAIDWELIARNYDQMIKYATGGLTWPVVAHHNRPQPQDPRGQISLTASSGRPPASA